VVNSHKLVCEVFYASVIAKRYKSIVPLHLLAIAGRNTSRNTADDFVGLLGEERCRGSEIVRILVKFYGVMVNFRDIELRLSRTFI